LTQTLIVGYGNPDREDDGVAWHILARLAQRLSLPEPAGDAESLAHLETSPHLLCLLQLNPELAELVAEYERVCFVDAHTGAYPEDIRCETIEGEYLPSPFTHHMTPPTLLMLAQTLYGRAPRALVVSVRGHKFGFSDQLSPATATLVETAIEQIIAWLQA
jgi:hydrogenase maturation protease